MSDYNRFQKWKVLSHSEKIKDITNGLIPYPVEWVIYPSNVCGYQCPHCIMARLHVDFKNTLSKEAMEKIPFDAKRLGIKCVIFSGGGDPLLNRYTVPVAHRLKSMGIQVGINNQGYLLSDPTAFDFVRYSVDAATRDTYKKIHGVDGWERVNQNIRYHADLREKGQKIEMGMAFLITPWNWKEIREFVEWAQGYEPDFIHIRPAFLDSDYLNDQYPDGGKEVKETIVPAVSDLAKDLTSKYRNVFFRVDKFEGFWTQKLYSKCRATPLIAVTSGDGAFLICQDRGIRKEESYLRWGDYNTQSFEEIWNSPQHRKVIDSIDLEKCPRCVENGYNEIIENVFMKDGLKLDIL